MNHRHPCKQAGSMAEVITPARTFQVIAGGGIPPGALTWETPAQRNRKLKDWQRGVFAVFGEQGRAMRVCWVLSSLFVNKGYCFATNRTLADMTVMAENKVQSTLKDLEADDAIVRGSVTDANGQKQRVIYPAIGILIRTASRHGGTPNLGVGGDPQQVGVHTYKRRIRLPKTQQVQAALYAERREAREKNRNRGKDQSKTEEDDPDG
jgi:hypothetical protein